MATPRHDNPISLLPAGRVVAAISALFAVLTLLFTYPIWTSPDSTLPGLGDERHQAWVMAWDAHALREDPARLFDTNTFYPRQNTLALSENLLATAVLVAPINWAGHPILAYNVALLASFFLSGLGMSLWARHLTASTAAGVFRGGAVDLRAGEVRTAGPPADAQRPMGAVRASGGGLLRRDPEAPVRCRSCGALLPAVSRLAVTRANAATVSGVVRVEWSGNAIAARCEAVRTSSVARFFDRRRLVGPDPRAGAGALSPGAVGGRAWPRSRGVGRSVGAADIVHFAVRLQTVPDTCNRCRRPTPRQKATCSRE